MRCERAGRHVRPLERMNSELVSASVLVSMQIGDAWDTYTKHTSISETLNEPIGYCCGDDARRTYDRIR